MILRVAQDWRDDSHLQYFVWLLTGGSVIWRFSWAEYPRWYPRMSSSWCWVWTWSSTECATWAPIYGLFMWRGFLTAWWLGSETGLLHKWVFYETQVATASRPESDAWSGRVSHLQHSIAWRSRSTAWSQGEGWVDSTSWWSNGTHIPEEMNWWVALLERSYLDNYTREREITQDCPKDCHPNLVAVSLPVK